jgi:hypothetical protein
MLTWEACLMAAEMERVKPLIIIIYEQPFLVWLHSGCNRRARGQLCQMCDLKCQFECRAWTSCDGDEMSAERVTGRVCHASTSFVTVEAC